MVYRGFVNRVSVDGDNVVVKGAKSIVIGRLLLYRYRVGGIVSSGYSF